VDKPQGNIAKLEYIYYAAIAAQLLL